MGISGYHLSIKQMVVQDVQKMVAKLIKIISLLEYCQDTGCDIGSKTLLAVRGKLPLKFICPATQLNKDEIYCDNFTQNILYAEQGNLGSCSACPIAVFFCQIYLQQGKWLCCMLG